MSHIAVFILGSHLRYKRWFTKNMYTLIRPKDHKIKSGFHCLFFGISLNHHPMQGFFSKVLHLKSKCVSPLKLDSGNSDLVDMWNSL